MELIKVLQSKESERVRLEQIYREAIPHFEKVEGRLPLAPLVAINEVIPDIPKESCQCLSIYYLKQLIGYLWIFEDSSTSFYILHFYVSENYRGLGLAGQAMDVLEKMYGERKQTAELVVSANNYLGLKFWTSIGFDKILHVFEPDQIESSAIELELQKEISHMQEDYIRLLPVTKENAFLGKNLKVTKKQENQGLVLAVPLAIQEALKRKTVEPYFIRLNNQVIGYTALVFDQEIPEEDQRHWLWQFMIDEEFQKQGYGSKALSLVIGVFERMLAPTITLSTKPENTSALCLYKRFGFVETGKSNGDEVILQKYL